MSRIGKKVIIIPEKVEVTNNKGVITIKGPKGELTHKLNHTVKIDIKENEILVDVDTANQSIRGLTRTLIHNMIIGVTEGFEKKLEINGVGYRAQKQGKNINLTLRIFTSCNF